MRYACDAWLGVPCTVMFDQNVPFSSTMIGRRVPAAVGTWYPPDSVIT